MSSAIVVGAGAGGLVAALYLQRAGHDVLLREAKSRVGGCASAFPVKDFRFLAGATGRVVEGDLGAGKVSARFESVTLQGPATQTFARELDARGLVADLEDLRVKVQDGREFAHLDAQPRTALLDASQRALDLVAPVADLSALPMPQRALLDETLAAIDQQLAEAALDRPRCKPERVTGSNRRVTVCRTRRARSSCSARRRPRRCCAPAAASA